ncbi:Apicidin F synthase [Dirofilaria immitis]|nr:Complement component c6 [Dirofilaria immitis]
MNSRARSRALSFGSFTKSSSGETRESGSTPLVKQSSEELSPIPESTEVEQPSDSVPEQIEFLVGEDTEQLSDVTDPDVYLTKSSAAKSRGSSSGRLFIWFARIYPLIKNKKVRYLMIINAILMLINVLMLLFVLALLLHQIILVLRISGITNRQRLPCIFTYNAWSSCSATCWDGSSNYPQMHRYVNKNSIVQARGGDKPDCPNDLINRIDFAPCNTFRCPTNLSHYPFTRCYYKDSLKESSGGCYRIRDVPLDDRLILMDTNLTQDCSKMECDRIERFLF